MYSFVGSRGIHFVGKFNELILQLASIENKHMTLIEYIHSYKSKLN